MKIVAGDFIQETFFDKNPYLDKRKIEIQVNHAFAYARKGYRDGVWLVGISPTGFKMRSRELAEGDHFFGQYKARRKGEAPRKAVKVLHVGEAPAAKYVDAIVYERYVLEEDRPVEHDGDAEIVGFLTKDSPEEEVMETEVLLHNFFGSDGGTNPNWTNDEFVEKLRESFAYWKSRAHIF